MKRQNVLNKKKKKKGFTLIELIIVMAIMAILALIAIPKFLGYKETANKNSDKLSARTIGNAAQTVFVEVGTGFTATIDATAVETNADKIEALLQTIPVGKQSGYKNCKFKAVVKDTGDVKVYLVPASGSDLLLYNSTATN